MIKLGDLLKEIDPTFGNSVFADPSQKSNSGSPTYADFLDLQGKSPEDAEVNTEKEEEIYDAIKDWTAAADDDAAEALTRNFTSIIRGKRMYPSVFAPDRDDGTPVYRGLENVGQRMLRTLSTNTTPEDWSSVQIPNTSRSDWFMCKKPVNYTPNRAWQSWSYSAGAATKFAGDGMLITKQDSNFYFSTKAMKIIFDSSDEQEILHSGRTFSNPVYIILDKYTLERVWDDEFEIKKTFPVQSLGDTTF